MTSSPELINELRASRPAAPAALRARVRELSAERPAKAPLGRFRFPVRRVALIAIPTAAALALASAGVVGLSRSDVSTEAIRQKSLATTTGADSATPAPNALGLPERAQSGTVSGGLTDTAIAPTTGRAQRVSATLTVEVADADAVSRAAQDALDLTRRLGGHVVNASVATGDEGSASLTVRVPVAKVQEAIVQLSALGRIVSQQIAIEDLQEGLDALERREASVRSQIARIVARLEFYTPEELTRIVTRSAGLLKIAIDPSGALEIARRSRGTPRIVNRLLRRVRDFAEVRAGGEIPSRAAALGARLDVLEGRWSDSPASRPSGPLPAATSRSWPGRSRGSGCCRPTSASPAGASTATSC